MEVGTEISQKIRSAIKAKLMEIGSYVDDELPDYIMVMVANKKTKQQMANDLCLFLGSNTDIFTTWLHGLLVKLQTVSADSNKAAETIKAKSISSKEKRKVDKKSKEDGGGVESKKEKRKLSKNSDGDALKAKAAKTDKVKKKVSDDSQTKEPPASKSSENLDANLQLISRNVEEYDAKLDDIEDVRQLLVTETHEDELAEELETTEAGIEKLASSNSVATARDPSSSSSHIIGKESVSISDHEKTVINRKPEAETVSLSRKRKCPSSVVAAVRREDNRNEESQSAPAVASVVKVTARKALPQSMQANSEIVSTAEGQGSGDSATCTVSPMEGIVSLSQVKQALSDVLTQWQDDQDDISTFCKCLDKTLRKMSQGDLAITKIKIQKIIFDYEMSQHQQASLSKNSTSSRVQSTISESTASSPGNVMKHATNETTLRLDNTAHSITSPAAGHLSCPSSSRSANKSFTSRDVNTHDSENFKRLDVGATSSRIESCETSERTAQRCGESLPDRIIFGPKLKEEEGLQPAQSRQPSEVKDSSSLESNCRVPVNENEVQSVSTAVSSSVIESSGLDSPSSSHPGNSIQMKWSSSSPSNNRQSLAADSLQRAKHSGSQPTILVTSLHQKRRFDPDSPSVLKQSLSHDPLVSKTSQPQSGEEVPDSSKEISPEQLKVLAKNLKITVVNKRALKPEDKSNSDDTSSEDSEEESDSAEEDSDEEDKDTEKIKETKDTGFPLRE